MSNSVGRFFSTLMAKILFAVLIVAFGAWGVADMLRTNPNREAVISVGEVDVTTLQAKRAFMRELQNLRQSFGPQLTVEDAAKFGVFNNVLSQLASRALLDAAAKDINVGVSDNAMQHLIMSNSAFLDETGKFSRDRFRRVLEQNGYNEVDFLAMTRNDLTRQRLIDSVTGPVVAPQILVDTLLRYEGEQRTVDYFTVAASDMPQPKDPGDEALKAYQNDNAARYTAPETRKLTVLLITPEAVGKALTFTEDDLKAYYEEHTNLFSVQETRNLSQILSKSKEDAEKVAKALKEGRALKTVAAEQKATLTNLGWVTHNSLLASISNPAFAAEKGAVLPPIQTPLGWHVFKVVDIRPASTKPFAEAKADVEKALRSDKIMTAIYDKSIAVEDAVSSGATLEEAAKLQGLKALSLPAVTANGQSNPDVPAIQTVAKAGYEQNEGEQSTLMEYEGEPGGYFIVRTDKITPSALKPFDSIRKDLLATWRGEQQQEEAVKKAADLAKTFAEAKSDKAFAKANKVTVKTSAPMYRSSQAELPQPLVKAIFDAKIGNADSAATADGAIVARLKEIKPVNLDDFKETLAEGKRQLRGSLGNIVMSPFTQQLTETFDMRQGRSVESLVQELK
jgi:peptidyl-prolyl cis-trans isomerase D